MSAERYRREDAHKGITSPSGHGTSHRAAYKIERHQDRKLPRTLDIFNPPLPSGVT